MASERAQSWRNALYAGAAFGVLFGLVMSWFNGWLPPADSGEALAIVSMMLAAGVLFGGLIGLFMASPIVPTDAAFALEPGEQIEHSGFANHFLNVEGRGGRLALTTRRLLFVPHAVNIQRAEVAIARSDIANVEPVKSLGVVPNGLAVTRKSGAVERFVVNGRAEWMRRLAQS